MEFYAVLKDKKEIERWGEKYLDIWEINLRDKTVKAGFLPPTPHGARTYKIGKDVDILIKANENITILIGEEKEEIKNQRDIR